MEILNAGQSIYAELAPNAVVSGELSDHEQSMISQSVSVRDGDDQIEYQQEEEVIDETPEDTQNDSNSDQANESSEQADPTEGDQPDSNEESAEESNPEASVSEGLDEAAKSINDHASTSKALIDEAISKGLPAEFESRLNEEYAAGGFSDETYSALAEAGYSKAFVDTYIKGQEAVAQQFVNSVVAFAGGQEAFSKVSSYMAAQMPDAVDTFNEAIERNDAKTIKLLINMTKSNMGKQFGKRPARTVVAKQAAPKAAPAVVAFSSRDEMVKAMSDRRYATDANYRQSIEQRVWASNL